MQGIGSIPDLPGTSTTVARSPTGAGAGALALARPLPGGASVHTTRGCYEDLPRELKKLISELSLEACPRMHWNFAAPAFEGLNHEEGLVHGQIADASRTIRALVGAGSATDFLQGLAWMTRVAPPYRGACRDAAWMAMSQFGHRLPDTGRDAILLQLLAGLDEDPARRTQRLRQATELLNRVHEKPSQPLVTALVLRSAEADPDGTRSWPAMLEHLVRRRYARQAPDRNALAALSPAQAHEVRLMFRCTRRSLVVDPHDMAPLVQRIEALRSPALRLAMLRMLSRSWNDLHSPQQAVARIALQGALLRLGGAQREQALYCLRHSDDLQVEASRLLEHSAPLAPAAALRVLTWGAHLFMRDEASTQDLEKRCKALIVRSRADPAGHPQCVRQLALLGREVSDPDMLDRLNALVLEECRQLAPRHRVGILARMKPRYRDLPAWHRHWNEALRASCRTPDDTTQDGAWQQVCALVEGLWPLRGRAALWLHLHPALEALTGDNRADALEAVARHFARMMDRCQDVNATRLLGHCRELPAHLRIRPLQALIAMGEKLSPHADSAFRAALQDTFAELAARIDY